MKPLSVGIREFRSRLAEYLLQGDRPVVVTRHGATVGYFIPARGARADLDRAALREAVAHMDELLQSSGLGEEDLDAVTKDFRAWRKSRPR